MAGTAWARASGALAIALLQASLLVGMNANPAAGANVSITLFGTAFGGWSTVSGEETNPGPTLAANLGDRVTMTLTSDDPPMGHTFWIDYDADGIIDLATEPSSPEFTATIMYSFDATVAGVFTYYCSIHAGPPYNPSTSLMRGTWITAAAPSIAFLAPTMGTSWTGGVAHDIRFDVASSDPPASLRIWVNYTYNNGALGGSIVGPIPGTANPNVVSWTPAGFSATDVVVNVTAIDTLNRRGFQRSSPFEVDSVRPAVATTVPAAGATGVSTNVQVRVTWSEGMNRAATAASDAFGVGRPSDMTWLPGSISWSSDSVQMTYTPGAALDPMTAYQVHVNTTARDDSDPGNTLMAPEIWAFMTGSGVDMTPPVIASVAATPSPQEEGGSVNLTATVTDNAAVGGVSALVVGPGLNRNFTMSPLGGDVWFLNRTYGTSGTYTFTFWATDASGNVASRGGSFVVQDTTPPMPPTGLTAVPSPDGTIRIRWAAPVDVDVIGYRVHRATAAGGPYSVLTATPIAADGTLEFVDRAAQARVVYFYAVTAVDDAGNESPFSTEASASIAAPPIDVFPFVIAAGVVAGVVVAGYLIWRRRRRP